MILTDEVVKVLASMDQQIVINTYNLISTAVPELRRENDSLFIAYSDILEEITYIEECIFNTLCEFTYLPLWYVHNLFKKMDLYSDPLKKISNWRKMGLVFVDQQTIGEFLRPTNYLYKLMQFKKKKYESIPYNMLTHDMSKMDIFLKIMIGNCEEIMEILKESFNDHDTAKKYAIEPLDILQVHKERNNEILNLLEGEKIPNYLIKETNFSLKVIDEKDIKINKDNKEKISFIENTIKNELKSGKLDTSELNDYSYFFVAIAEGEGYILQFPDLIVPIKRNNNGKPNSIAIEMELTCKSINNYKKNLMKYKNSLKFGSVVWFCADNRIKRTITEAFKEIGGTGFTNTYLYDYVPPKRQDIIV